jgi:hypothetical protein
MINSAPEKNQLFDLKAKVKTRCVYKQTTPWQQYIRYANNQRFFPLKLKKWFGVLLEYPIIHNILIYNIGISGVDCTPLTKLC